MVLHEHRRLGLRVAAPRDRADTGSVMRRIVRVGICVIAVGVIATISVAGAGSKTIRATPAAARTATAPRLRPLVPAGVACPVASTSSSACSAKPCTVFVQSAAAPTVRRALAPRNPRCAAKANALPRVIPISAPVAGETVTRTAGR